MVGRATANVFIFAVSVAAVDAAWYRRPETETFTFGGSSKTSLDAQQSSAANLLDTSQWLAQDRTLIRVNGKDVASSEEMARPSPVVAAMSSTLVASVRPRRRMTFFAPKEASESEANAIAEEAKEEHIDPEILKAVSKIFVPKAVWSRLRGSEFENPDVIDELVETGLAVTRSEDNEWVSWTSNNRHDDEAATNDDDVRVHVGRCSRQDHDQYYGANLPMVKTEAIINMTPKEMADLLLDSSRVHVYNKMSVGRKDIREIPCEAGIAKIVRNLTQPPITKKKVVSTTFMHARKVSDNGAYLVVSRAVTLPDGENEFSSGEEHGKSEILLGVNLLEPCDDNKSLKMTCVTHVYSPAIPVVLAKRVGVNSALSFVKDIRSICEQN